MQEFFSKVGEFMFVTIVRTAILYVAIIVAIRLMGKRQLGDLQPAELVVTILISELAAVPMQDPGIPLLYGIVPIIVLLSLELLIAALALKFPALRRLFGGKTDLLIYDGVIDQNALRKNLLSSDELTEELRLAGAPSVEMVHSAILETNGRLSVILRNADQPLTNGGAGVHGERTGLPLVLISDGHVVTENIKLQKRSDRWLGAQLKKHHLSVREVFLMIADEFDNVYILRKEENK